MEHKQAIIALFQQEAQTAARLNHPNIVTIYQVIHSKNDYFIVMELLKGKSLETWLKEKRHTIKLFILSFVALTAMSNKLPTFWKSLKWLKKICQTGRYWRRLLCIRD
ncbi:protein kinase [Desulfococcaceae bacterium HSG7]|nr:protein kinase [Desulfococcaceae bacterium HSG7]